MFFSVDSKFNDKCRAEAVNRRDSTVTDTGQKFSGGRTLKNPLITSDNLRRHKMGDDLKKLGDAG